jgi:hypothetical protein
MLTKLFSRLQSGMAQALQAKSSHNKTQPPPWWLAAYEQAPTDDRFGPAERNELGRLVDALGLDLSHSGRGRLALTYTTLHGYLCCIVVGPPGLPTAAWLAPLLPLPEQAEPHFVRLLRLMRLMVADIEKDFNRPKPHLRLPALGVSQGPRTKTPGPALLPLSAWCAAFLLATAIEHSKWAAKWAVFGPPDTGEGHLLEIFWIYGTDEGRQYQKDDAYRCYLQDGYSPSQARQMVSRFLLLPSTHRNMLAGLRRHLVWFWKHWRGRDYFKWAHAGGSWAH